MSNLIFLFWRIDTKRRREGDRPWNPNSFFFFFDKNGAFESVKKSVELKKKKKKIVDHDELNVGIWKR